MQLLELQVQRLDPAADDNPPGTSLSGILIEDPYLEVIVCRTPRLHGPSAAYRTYPDEQQIFVELNDDLLSLHHLRLVWSETAEGWLVEDLGSEAGTTLDDTRLHSPAPIEPGMEHQIMAGRHKLLVRVIPSEDPTCRRRIT
jgi:pSer/pThr/pTyr-binding forkhead associated (FHA) protein